LPHRTFLHLRWEMSKYQIRVDSLPTDRTKMISAARLIGHMGLTEASNLVRHLEEFNQSLVVAGVEQDVADHIAGVLREAGASISIECSSINTPMLCAPEVNAKYTWGAFRSFKKVV
jgi:hypothetical protein